MSKQMWKNWFNEKIQNDISTRSFLIDGKLYYLISGLYQGDEPYGMFVSLKDFFLREEHNYHKFYLNDVNIVRLPQKQEIIIEHIGKDENLLKAFIAFLSFRR